MSKLCSHWRNILFVMDVIWQTYFQENKALICVEFTKFSVYVDINMSPRVPFLLVQKLKCKLYYQFPPHPIQVRFQAYTTVLLRPQLVCVWTWSRLVVRCRRFGSIFRFRLINHQPRPSRIRKAAPVSEVNQIFQVKLLKIAGLPNTTNIML